MVPLMLYPAENILATGSNELSFLPALSIQKFEQCRVTISSSVSKALLVVGIYLRMCPKDKSVNRIILAIWSTKKRKQNNRSQIYHEML